MTAQSVTAKRASTPKPRTDKARKIIKLKQDNPQITCREIAKIADCDHSNVVRILQRYNLQSEHIQGYKDNRADVLAGLQSRLLHSITDADIQKSPLGSRVLAVAQLYDKERLERGQSTSNVSMLDVNKRLETLKAERAEIQARLSGKADTDNDVMSIQGTE